MSKEHSQASEEQPPDEPGSEDSELAQAFKDLSKGERTATMMENQLSAIERKIEELLARTTEQQTVTNGTSAHDSTETTADERK